MVNVTKYDIAFIGIRLLAIYTALGAISSLPSWVMTTQVLFSQPSSGISKLLVILLLLLVILIPVFLWVSSSKIALFITNGSKLIEAKGNEKSDVDLQAIFFCVIGIFILVTNIPQLIAWMYAFISTYKTQASGTMGLMQLFSGQQEPSIIPLIVVSLKIILSTALIFTAQNLSMFFYRLRNAGLNRDK